MNTLRAVLVLLPLLFAACGESAEARELRDSLGKTLDATKALAVKTWADLQQQAQPMLADANQQLAGLQTKLEDGGQQVSQKTRDALAAARREIDEAAAAVASAKDAGADSAAKAWSSFREALGHAHTSLQQAAAELNK